MRTRITPNTDTFHAVEATEYHQRVCEKAESFLRTFENPTHAVSHDKKRQFDYEPNVHILK